MRVEDKRKLFWRSGLCLGTISFLAVAVEKHKNILYYF